MLDLSRIPPGYPVSWAYAPSTRKLDDLPNCDVPGCEGTPKWEIFFEGFGDDQAGQAQYWWYVCKEHRDWLKRNMERGA